MAFNKEEYWNKRQNDKNHVRTNGTITVYVCALCQNQGTTLRRLNNMMVCQGKCPPKNCSKCHSTKAMPGCEMCSLCSGVVLRADGFQGK